MAMARHAPRTYRRKHHISRHAVERLRERCPEESNLLHRDERDLANWIDHAVRDGLSAKRFFEVKERTTGDRVRVVELSGYVVDESCPLWAICKEDAHRPEGPEAVVTLLTEEMVEKHRETVWARKGAPFNPALKLSKEKLEELAAAEEDHDIHAGPRVAAEPAENQNAVESKSEIDPDDPRARFRVIAGSEVFGFATQEGAVAKIERLADEGRDGVRLFREVPLKVRREIRVELAE